MPRSSRRGARTTKAASVGCESRSTLKPRVRKPLQNVVESRLNEEANVLQPTNRHVSFAVSEVKEFPQPGNEGTVWGNTYTYNPEKSSSESGRTESSTINIKSYSSGSCRPGQSYICQTRIEEETVSVSYCFEDGNEEEHNFKQPYKNKVFLDKASQTDGSIYQKIDTRKCVKGNRVNINNQENIKYCLKPSVVIKNKSDSGVLMNNNRNVQTAGFRKIDVNSYSSGRCGPGLSYIRHIRVEETVSVSYELEDSDDENSFKQPNNKKFADKESQTDEFV